MGWGGVVAARGEGGNREGVGEVVGLGGSAVAGFVTGISFFNGEDMKGGGGDGAALFWNLIYFGMTKRQTESDKMTKCHLRLVAGFDIPTHQ